MGGVGDDRFLLAKKQAYFQGLLLLVLGSGIITRGSPTKDVGYDIYMG